MTTQVAFLFPGQGSQSVGMGADAFAASPAAKSVFETVDAALGFLLSSLCFDGPEEALRETINTQPAIVMVSLALLAAFQERLSPEQKFSSWSSPLVPSYTAGHSVGEYAALVASGVLELSDAARLVRERGRLMHHEGTVCPGGMAAVIGMDEETLRAVCQEATDEASTSSEQESATDARHPGMGKVIVANFNAPGQIVISGEQQALELAMAKAKERGAKRVIPLVVSGAFHSPVMQSAASELARAIDATEMRDATVPIVGNMNAQPLRTVQELRSELSGQIAASVQWTHTIEYLTGAGVTIFIEIGPGQALTGMVKRIAKGVTTLNISNMADVEKAVSRMQESGLPRDV